MNQWTNPVPSAKPLHLHELGHPDAATKDPTLATDSYLIPGVGNGLTLPPLFGPNINIFGINTLIRAYLLGALCNCNVDEVVNGASEMNGA